jgi:hypothetical protein
MLLISLIFSTCNCKGFNFDLYEDYKVNVFFFLSSSHFQRLNDFSKNKKSYRLGAIIGRQNIKFGLPIWVQNYTISKLKKWQLKLKTIFQIDLQTIERSCYQTFCIEYCYRLLRAGYFYVNWFLRELLVFLTAQDTGIWNFINKRPHSLWYHVSVCTVLVLVFY